MSGFLATLKRELRAYFFSPLAYVILTLFLLVNGGIFWLIVSFLSDPRAGGSTTPLKLFFGDTFLFWLVLMFVTPILTMRLLAEERRSGTIESLMTAPVTEIEVILGKYFAALLFYLFLWLPTLVYVGIVAQNSTVDWGPIASGYLGVTLIGGLCMAIGVFGSSFAKNQIVAAMVTFALLLTLFIVIFLESLVTSEMWQGVFKYISLAQHMDEFGNGIIDTRRLIFYVTSIALFLYLSARSLELKKWR